MCKFIATHGMLGFSDGGKTTNPFIVSDGT